MAGDRGGREVHVVLDGRQLGLLNNMLVFSRLSSEQLVVHALGLYESVVEHMMSPGSILVCDQQGNTQAIFFPLNELEWARLVAVSAQAGTITPHFSPGGRRRLEALRQRVRAPHAGQVLLRALTLFHDCLFAEAMGVSFAILQSDGSIIPIQVALHVTRNAMRC